MVAETLGALSLDAIEHMRAAIVDASAASTSVAAAASAMTTMLAAAARTVVLARVFVVVPFARLPAVERAWATTCARSAGRVSAIPEHTPVLTLLGTAGIEDAWNDRERSSGHRAIPLVDRAFVDSAPMIGALLSSLRLDLGQRNDGSVELRAVAGGLNARFLVEDAATTHDRAGRHIIGARAFVESHRVRSVFGMGGSYVGGELAIAIVFTREALDAATVDRFTSLISTFKMTTSSLLSAGQLLPRG